MLCPPAADVSGAAASSCTPELDAASQHEPARVTMERVALDGVQCCLCAARC